MKQSLARIVQRKRMLNVSKGLEKLGENSLSASDKWLLSDGHHTIRRELPVSHHSKKEWSVPSSAPLPPKWEWTSLLLNSVLSSLYRKYTFFLIN